DPDEKAALLDRAKLGEDKMPAGRLGVAKPRIVRHADEDVRGGAGHQVVDEARVNVLEADQRRKQMVPERQRPCARARDERAGVGEDPAEPRKPALPRQVLAEREKELLVAAATRADSSGAVPD